VINDGEHVLFTFPITPASSPARYITLAKDPRLQMSTRRWIMVTYRLRMFDVGFAFLHPTTTGFLAELRKIEWASYLLAFSSSD